jgi:hypothetical protein
MEAALPVLPCGHRRAERLSHRVQRLLPAHSSPDLWFAAMSDLLDDIRSQINSRIEELRPLVEEAEQLAAALDALATPAAPPERNGRRANRRSSPTRGQAVRQRSDIRAAVIEYIAANPGATAAGVATALNLKRTAVATRLTQLVKSGALVKAQRGYSAP